MVVEFRNGGEVCREGGKAVFGRFAVGFDGESSVGREALVDEILPCVAKVLNVRGMFSGKCSKRRGSECAATVDAA